MPYDQEPTIWIFSILTDIYGRIEEFRGQAEEKLGAPLRQLASKSILDLVWPEDRTTFLQSFGQLGGSQLPPAFAVRMAGAANEPTPFIVKFEKGPSLRSHWLMFVERNETNGRDLIASAAERHFQGDAQFLSLVEMAARQQNSEIDVTIIGVEALQNQKSRSKLGQARSAELESSVDRRVLGAAQMGLASKSGAGSYSVVHDRNQPLLNIEQEIREAAEKIGVAEAELGLKAVTVRVPSGASVLELRAKFREAGASTLFGLEEAEEAGLPSKATFVAIGLGSIVLGAVIGWYLTN